MCRLNSLGWPSVKESGLSSVIWRRRWRWWRWRCGEGGRKGVCDEAVAFFNWYVTAAAASCRASTQLSSKWVCGRGRGGGSFQYVVKCDLRLNQLQVQRVERDREVGLCHKTHTRSCVCRWEEENWRRRGHTRAGDGGRDEINVSKA